MTLTLAQIRTQVRAGILDENSTEIAANSTIDAVINRAVSVLAREYNLAQATISVSFANATANGVVDSRTQTATPTVTYNAFTKWPTYKISDCIRMIDMSRDVSVADGKSLEIREATMNQIDEAGLKYDNADIITHYVILKSNDFRVQFFPKLNTGGYTHSVKMSYVMMPPALVQDADIPELPDAYHGTIIPTAIAILERDLGRPERAQGAEEIAAPEKASARDFEQSR